MSRLSLSPPFRVPWLPVARCTTYGIPSTCYRVPGTSQFAEALTIISKVDFPARWPNLIQDLVGLMKTSGQVSDNVSDVFLLGRAGLERKGGFGVAGRRLGAARKGSACRRSGCRSRWRVRGSRAWWPFKYIASDNIFHTAFHAPSTLRLPERDGGRLRGSVYGVALCLMFQGVFSPGFRAAALCFFVRVCLLVVSYIGLFFRLRLCMF